MNEIQNIGVRGFYQARVMNADGTPAGDWTAPTKNLILPSGYLVTAGGSYPGAFSAQLGSFHVGTGTTPNSAALDGTFQQSGTTVTRAAGTGVFVGGNVNDFIKFASGEIAKIVTFTNSVTVEVDRAQTVAAAALTVYDTSRVTLDAWVKATTSLEGGGSGNLHDYDAGTFQVWQTMNFSTETVARTYTELGVTANGTSSGSALFSRVLLDSPVNVGIDQFLQVRFDLIMQLGNYRTSAPITVSIAGWPYTYNVQSIVSNGTYWDVVVSPACNAHYATGRPITIAGALPATTVISTISSTVSDFTVNSTAHGKSPGDSIVIAGATPAGYNGTWTVATVPNANSLTVTSAANLGAGSGGTVRLATPGTWYDGTHTIASFPNATTIRITNANNIVPAGVAGTVRNSLAAVAQVTGNAFNIANQPGIVEPGATNSLSLNKSAQLFNEANLKTGMAYGVPINSTGAIGITGGVGAYDATNRRQTLTYTAGSSVAVSTTLRQIAFGTTAQPTGQFVITFDERQRKDNGFQLVLSFTLSWDPDLN